MLTNLRITNFGVVSNAELTFGNGLSVVTGETGAGKTMVINALNQTLGSKASNDLIRSGSSKAILESEWQLTADIADTLREMDLAIDGDQLTLSRILDSSGKSRIALDGVTSNASQVAELSQYLVEVVGQHDQRMLTKPRWQLQALDRFGGPAHLDLVLQVRNAFDTLKSKMGKLNKLHEELNNWEIVRERYLEELAEFDRVNPLPNEDDSILDLISQQEQVQESQDLLNLILNLLSAGDENSIAQTLTNLRRITGKLDMFADLDSDFSQAIELLNDLDSTVSNLLNDDQSEMSLDQLYSRKADLNSLIRKHGMPLNEIINMMQFRRNQLDNAASPASFVEQLTIEISNEKQQLAQLSDNLNHNRKQIAQTLSAKVSEELAGLKMSKTKFVVRIESSKSIDGIEINNRVIGTYGYDDISFEIEHGKNARSITIAKSASGGELSRILLAMQLVLTDNSAGKTFIFDEIDAGIGGETAIEVGRRLAKLAKHHQVIVVTHLPQIAAFANQHFKVMGDVADGIKTSDVFQLSADLREAEIARMLGGIQDSTAAMEHARELLNLNT